MEKHNTPCQGHAAEQQVKHSWEAVIADMKTRNLEGFNKYRKFLTPTCSEDMLQMAYEEALDLAVYLKTEILQRKLHD